MCCSQPTSVRQTGEVGRRLWNTSQLHLCKRGPWRPCSGQNVRSSSSNVALRPRRPYGLLGTAISIFTQLRVLYVRSGITAHFCVSHEPAPRSRRKPRTQPHNTVQYSSRCTRIPIRRQFTGQLAGHTAPSLQVGGARSNYVSKESRRAQL